MGKFCTKCGKPLAQGELCTCQMGKPAAAPGPQGAPGGYIGQANPMRQAQGGQPQYRRPGPNPAQTQPGQQMPGGAYAQGSQAAQNGNQSQFGQQMPGGQVQNMQQASMGRQQYQQQQYQQQVQQQYQQVHRAASGYLAKTIGTFLNIVKNPIQTGKNMIAFADMGVIVSLIVLQAVFSGFFSIAVMAKISGLSMGYIKMPIARGFFVTVMFSCILSFALAGLLMCGNLMIKNTVTYKQMLACAAVRSVLLVLTTLVSIIVFLLIPSAGFFLFYSGSLWGMIAIALIMPKNIDGKEDKIVLIQFLSAILFLICFVIFIQISWKAYIPDAIGTMMNGMDSLLSDPSAILENIF